MGIRTGSSGIFRSNRLGVSRLYCRFEVRWHSGPLSDDLIDELEWEGEMDEKTKAKYGYIE
jgi:hypothetical protein